MSEQEFTPVYLITGFLESGKTQLINSMLTDDNFSRGQKTLVICCEEGVEEYETAKNTTVVVLDEADEMNTKKMEALDKEYQPERVIIEYNSIWTIERLGLDGFDVVVDFRDLEAALDRSLAPLQGRLLSDLGLAGPLALAHRLVAELAPCVPTPARLQEVALTDGTGRRLAVRA